MNVGTESVDDETLKSANKGYTSKDISLTLFSDTRLYQLEKEGKFIAAGEKERLEELQVFVRSLRIRMHLLANAKSNFVPLTAYHGYCYGTK
ncbi:MAG: hypothetical protein Q4F83_12955 [Eubacteriales bacterium]|nr:hypothetical protein [Eubacteriales bacterium]